LIRKPHSLRRRKPVVSRVERLEDRTLLSYSSTLAAGVITMTGDSASETLTIGQAGDGNLIHNPGLTAPVGQSYASAEDFDSALAGVQAIPVNGVTTLTINGGTGNEIIELDSMTLSAATGITILGSFNTVDLN